MAAYKITLTTTNWTSAAGIWYDRVSALFYADSELTTEISKVDPALRECWRFLGWYNSASGSTQYIDENGEFTDDLRSKCASQTSAFTIVARGERTSYKLTLSSNGGESENTIVYGSANGDAGRFFRDWLCETEPISSFEKPVYSGRIFNGYFNGSSTPGAQFVDKDGNFTEDLQSLALSADKTIYANWKLPVKVTVSAQNGSGGTSAFYRDNVNGLWYLDTTFDEPITSITPHARECYVLLGVYNSTSGSTQYVAPNGTIDTTWAPTDALTIYCKWSQVSYKITLSKQSGTGGSNALYTKKDETPKKFYAEYACVSEVDSITVPTRTGYSFEGYFSSSSGGTQYVNKNGTFTADFVSLAQGNKTIYARWKAVVKITLNANGGTAEQDKFFYSVSEALYYDDDKLTNQISSVTPPVRTCWAFNGYFNTTTGTTKYVDSTGAFTSALTSLAPTSAKTFYAQWTRKSFALTLDDNGGTGGCGAIFNGGTGANYYLDDDLTNLVTSVPVPARPGYAFAGYYSARTGGSMYINNSGVIVAIVGIDNDTTVYAHWIALTYTLSFDYDGGSGAVASKTVTSGQAIGTLPAATHPQARLEGWYLGGTKINASSLWNTVGDATAVARWNHYFGNLLDFFNADGARLMLVDSDSGEGRRVTNLWNGAYEQGGKLKNPVCTYRVKSAGTVGFTLGHCYGSYFLIGVEYVTGADKEPKLILRGMANEGQNAINLYSVMFRVDPDHTAQDPLGAVCGGGELVDCATKFDCDPAVAYENSAPCASDICHGRVSVSATTAAYFMESAPTGGGGFIETSAPEIGSDVDFTTYKFAAERSL